MVGQSWMPPSSIPAGLFLGELTFFRGVVQIHVAMRQEYWIRDAWFSGFEGIWSPD